jgi:hypothetical protein
MLAQFGIQERDELRRSLEVLSHARDPSLLDARLNLSAFSARPDQVPTNSPHIISLAEARAALDRAEAIVEAEAARKAILDMEPIVRAAVNGAYLIRIHLSGRDDVSDASWSAAGEFVKSAEGVLLAYEF